jgi:cytochrome P450
MLENRRCFPVADSLPHQVAEDVEIEGYRFKKGDFFLGSLASIMRNPG